MKTTLRAATIGAGLTLFVVGAIGALHLPFAAPLLRKVMPGSICPVMRGTPAQIDRARSIAAAAIRAGASSSAPVRFALGFQLDVSKKGDVDAWASTYGASCSPIAGNDNLRRCIHVPAVALGESADLLPLEEATFEFNSSGRLVNVQTLRRRLSLEQAARTVDRLERQASSLLGAPATLAGEPTVAHLSRGLLSTYVAVHVFADYRATVSATNLAPTGVMVREEYLSVVTQ